MGIMVMDIDAKNIIKELDKGIYHMVNEKIKLSEARF